MFQLESFSRMISIIQEYEKRISPYLRIKLKYKMLIWQKYCNRYLKIELNLWFKQLVMTPRKHCTIVGLYC